MHRFLLFFGAVALASASSVFTFDFNSLNPTFAPASGPVNDSSISSALTTLLQSSGCTGCTVTVSGAFVDTTYTGENHTVGSVSGSYSPVTLGTSDYANCNSTSTGDSCTNNPYAGTTMTVHPSSTDSFLANTDNNSGTGSPASNAIMMTFSGLTISSVGFDYEIFPNGTCSSSSNCPGGKPTFEFKAGNNSLADVTGFGTNGVVTAVYPGSGSVDGNATRSGSMLSETAAQYIGTWQGSLSGANANANQLDFIDWPATIGIDNLQITYTKTAPAVPEPMSVVLLGTLVAGFALRKKLHKAA